MGKVHSRLQRNDLLSPQKQPQAQEVLETSVAGAWDCTLFHTHLLLSTVKRWILG